MPVLLYHRLGPEGEDNLPSDKFEDQIYRLQAGGFEIVSLPIYLQQDSSRRKNSIVISFDDGMRNIYRYAFPLVLKYKFNFTVFLNYQFIGLSHWHSKTQRAFYSQKKLAPAEEREKLWFFEYLSREEIMAMQEKGIIFGSHGQSHRLLTKLSLKELREELDKKALAEMLEKEIMYFSYPWGTCNWRVKREAKKSGYKFAFISSLSLREDAFSMGRLLVKKDWDGDRLISEIKCIN